MRIFILSFALLLSAATSSRAFSWDGEDTTTGQSVEIERGNLVRSGRTVEVYNNDTGEYREVDVDDVRRYGNNVELDVTDLETGESTTLEMEDE